MREARLGLPPASFFMSLFVEILPVMTRDKREGRRRRRGERKEGRMKNGQ